jgi:hypothetical protein
MSERQKHRPLAASPQMLGGSHEWVDSDGPSIVGRMAWLIAGFNIGFILFMGMIVLGLPLLMPSLEIRRTESADAGENFDGETVIVQQPTATPTSTVTLRPQATVTHTPAPPTATVDIAATGTTEALLAQPSLTPSPPPTRTPLPSPTLIPPTATPQPPPVSYQLEGIRFEKQGYNNCGPANLAMGLSYFDWNGTEADTASYLKPNAEDKNVTPQEMVDYVNQLTNLSAIWRAAGSIEQIQWLVANEFVVIVESGYAPGVDGWFGHYKTVVGYDASREIMRYYDSYLGSKSRPELTLNYDEFDKRWQAFNRNYIVIYPPQREEELKSFLGTDWIITSNRRKAAEIAQQEARENNDDVFAWFNLGTSLNALGRYEEAAIAYQRASEIGMPYRMLWYQFGPYEAFLQTGQLDNVLKLANDTRQTTQYVEETYYYRGRVFEVRGDYPSAITEYETALEYNSNYKVAQAALDRVKRLSGQ